MDEVTPIILAGGLGTRLRESVSDRPKVLAPVAGRPFLERIFEQLLRFGFKKVVLCIGYMGNQIEDLYGSSYAGMNISYSRENALLGTAGALRQAIDQVSSCDVLVLNGDSFCNFSFEFFFPFHVRNQADISILLVTQDDCSRFGSVVLDDSFRVQTFHEKSNSTGPGLVNAGIYLIKRSLIQELRSGENLSLERNIFPNLIARRFFGYIADVTTFIDIGTPQSFSQAQDIFSPAGLE